MALSKTVGHKTIVHQKLSNLKTTMARGTSIIVASWHSIVANWLSLDM